MTHKHVFFTILAILLVALALTGCGEAAAARISQIPEVTIIANDYAYDAPGQIEAGLVSLTLVNRGQEPHHAQLVRLKDGVTVEEFQAALQEGEAAALPLVTFSSGPGLIDPDQQSTVTVNLTPGQYLLMCFIANHDGVPHLALGMVQPIEVVAGSGQAQVAEPQADATVKLMDFSFVLPVEIKAGRQVWQVVNEGGQAHEIMLVKLAEGKTMDDVQTFMHSPHGAPPFTNIGGFQAIDPGASGWLHLDLQPGDYIAICHVPDPATGHAHSELGMVIPFTVK